MSRAEAGRKRDARGRFVKAAPTGDGDDGRRGDAGILRSFSGTVNTIASLRCRPPPREGEPRRAGPPSVVVYFESKVVRTREGTF